MIAYFVTRFVTRLNIFGGFLVGNRKIYYLCRTKQTTTIMREKNITKEPVTIRFKELANGNKSIYLDIYKDGKRAYEFLKLYLLPETGKERMEHKRKNKETMEVANLIKAQRTLDIKNGMVGIENKNKGKMKLLDYIDKFIQHKKEINPGYEDGFLNRMKSLVTDYKGSNVLMKDIDKDWCMGYIKFLGTTTSHRGKPLGRTSVRTYYKYFSTVIIKAAKDGIIPKNPLEQIGTEEKPSGNIDAGRVYLTIDEVKKMAETDCENENIKRAFMFSCFCGLRISDIRKLKWSEIERVTDKEGKEHYRLSITMQKTQKSIAYQLSSEAIKWLPEQGEGEFVFDHLTKKTKLCMVVRDWAKAAGIKKYVTFHTARHSFATMMLTLGADIYTTSKLLGHSKISTTEIYAKIIDQKKDEAMGLIDKFFDKD